MKYKIKVFEVPEIAGMGSNKVYEQTFSRLELSRLIHELNREVADGIVNERASVPRTSVQPPQLSEDVPF